MTLELLNKENNKFNSIVNITKIYPVEEVGEQVSVNNAYVKDGQFIFDLLFENLDINEFGAVRIVPLNFDEVAALNNGGMPNSLTDNDKKILFENASDVQVFNPQVEINDIKVSFKELIGDNFFVLVVLEDFPKEASDIFLVSTNKHLLVDFSTTKAESYKETFKEKYTEPTHLQEIEDKSYVSDVLYSCNPNGNISGVFCLDKQKIIKEFTKFPRLISIDNNTNFDQLLLGIEMCFYEYDKNENGYIFSDKVRCVKPQVADDVAVLNKSGYRFYNFSINLENLYSDFQLVLKFELNDITINLAKSTLEQLKIIRDGDDRTGASIILSKIYGKDVETSFGFKMSNLNKIPTVDFKILMNKIIDDMAKQIQNFSQKIVVNTNIKSQYTQPKLSNSTFYRVFFQQKFQKKISLKDKKENDFFGDLNTNFGFPVIPINNIQTENINIFSTSSKSFKVVADKPKVTGFVSISKKDIQMTNEGLRIKVNLSDADQKLQNFLAQKQTEKFINFVANKERKIKVYYLKLIGNSVSSLVFNEIDNDFTEFLSSTNKVLIRIDNYEEFYSSYAYVVGE